MLRKFISHIAGALFGTLNGLLLGVVDAADKLKLKRTGAYGLLFFIPIFPFFSLYYGLKGFYKGATQGFSAGSTYFRKTMNRWNAEALERSLPSESSIPDLLSSRDLDIYEKYYVNSLPGSTNRERRYALDLFIEIEKYREYILILQTKGYYGFKKPVLITIGNQEKVVEYDFLRNKIKDAIKNEASVIEEKTSKIIKPGNIKILYPYTIIEFIGRVKNIVSDLFYLKGEEVLTQENYNSSTTRLAHALNITPQPQVTIQPSVVLHGQPIYSSNPPPENPYLTPSYSKNS